VLKVHVGAMVLTARLAPKDPEEDRVTSVRKEILANPEKSGRKVPRASLVMAYQGPKVNPAPKESVVRPASKDLLVPPGAATAEVDKVPKEYKVRKETRVRKVKQDPKARRVHPDRAAAMVLLDHVVNEAPTVPEDPPVSPLLETGTLTIS